MSRLINKIGPHLLGINIKDRIKGKMFQFISTKGTVAPWCIKGSIATSILENGGEDQELEGGQCCICKRDNMKSKMLIRIEDAEANRRKLDTSWFKRRIRHSAGQHRESGQWGTFDKWAVFSAKPRVGTLELCWGNKFRPCGEGWPQFWKSLNQRTF